MRYLLLLLVSVMSFTSWSQDQNDYYYEIPDAPEQFNEHAVAARMVDGLGFRFYWASVGLTEKDLGYKPSEKGRTTLETIEHIEGLSFIILSSVLAEPVDFPREENKLNYEDLRAQILENIKKTSDLLREKNMEMTEYKAIFRSENGTSEFPFWNLINGPIADALWHTGQVVLLRRASGNPFNSNVSVLRGKLRDN